MSGPNRVYNTLIHVVVIILIIKLLKRKSSVNQRVLVVSSFMYSTNDLRIPFKVTEWATYNYVLYICAYVCGYVYKPRRGLPVWVSYCVRSVTGYRGNHWVCVWQVTVETMLSVWPGDHGNHSICVTRWPWKLFCMYVIGNHGNPSGLPGFTDCIWLIYS